MMYRHTAVITGRGDFPLDMLRYDAAYPKSSEDVDQITNSIAERYVGSPSQSRYKVQIVKRSDNKQDTFTAGRWQSFGATVETITSERL